MMNKKDQNIKEAIDLLVGDEKNITSMIQEGGLLKKLTKALMEKALEAEMEDHLGYDRYNRSSNENYRNGTGGKTLISESGPLDIEVPRDRNGSFAPQIVKKRQTR